MKRMLSGIKPSGISPTLGNYIGAIREFVKYQEDYELFVFIADLHALTIRNNLNSLQESIENLLAIYVAAGLDPQKTCIFRQSDVPAHNQLEWLLTCHTEISELTKMPQYKNFLEKNKKSSAVPAGMLLYPSLMNADILLYDADYVPVGEDQKPHIDLTRDIAERFNKYYGTDCFHLPSAIIPKQGAKIMSLSDPTKKMSKSESDKGTIYLLDDLNTVRQKIKKAVTDNESRIYYDPEHKPGISNLLMIYACLTDKTIAEVEYLFKNETDYGVFKTEVANVVCAELEKLQQAVINFKKSNMMEQILQLGKQKAEAIANIKINTLYKKVGLR